MDLHCGCLIVIKTVCAVSVVVAIKPRAVCQDVSFVAFLHHCLLELCMPERSNLFSLG